MQSQTYRRTHTSVNALLQSIDALCPSIGAISQSKEAHLQSINTISKSIDALSNVRSRRSEFWQEQTWLCHHDNAPSHTSILTQHFLAKY